MLNGFLKQSTASQTRITPPFVDDTDFKTLETALTIANTDVKLSKNGAAAVNKNSGGGTHIVNGKYALTFDATDTDTVGEFSASIKVAGALVVDMKFWVLEEAIYDSLFGASAAGFDASQRVDLGRWLGTAPNALVSQRVDASVGAMAADVVTAAAVANGAIDAATFAAGAIDAAAIAADAIGASELAADAVAEIADAIWDEAKAGHVGVGSFGEEVQAHALSSEVSAVQSDTDDIQTRLPAALVGGRMDSSVGAIAAGVDFSATQKASINAEVVDTLNVDTYAEIGQETPAATQTIRKMLGFLYKMWRNRKTQTASQLSLFNDDAVTVDQKATVSDDGTTTTVGEIATGP